MTRRFAMAAVALSTVALTATGAPAASAAASSPQDVCGSSYRTIDRHAISGATIYLTYNGTSNCVATIKTAHVGTATYVAAWLRVQGDGAAVDQGNYKYYAGPVKLTAAGKCVIWGGATQNASWQSGWSHCG